MGFVLGLASNMAANLCLLGIAEGYLLGADSSTAVARRFSRFFGLVRIDRIGIYLSNLWSPQASLLSGRTVGYTVSLDELRAAQSIDKLFGSAPLRLPDMVRGLVDALCLRRQVRCVIDVSPLKGEERRAGASQSDRCRQQCTELGTRPLCAGAAADCDSHWRGPGIRCPARNGGGLPGARGLPVSRGARRRRGKLADGPTSALAVIAVRQSTAGPHSTSTIIHTIVTARAVRVGLFGPAGVGHHGDVATTAGWTWAADSAAAGWAGQRGRCAHLRCTHVWAAPAGRAAGAAFTGVRRGAHGHRGLRRDALPDPAAAAGTERPA